jgi:8-oxo-dGTP pyrophosphatase MutT (NUDIX family)
MADVLSRCDCCDPPAAMGSTTTGPLPHDRRVRTEKACGVLLFQERPRCSFLLLLHKERVDLPKGKVKGREDELACALRELEEETGIAPHAVRVVDGFRYKSRYLVRRDGERVEKTVVLFAAEIDGPTAVVTPDHDSYAWIPWPSEHRFDDAPTVSGVLQAWSVFAHRHRDRLSRYAASTEGR